MNQMEKKMTQLLIELKEKHCVVGVKAEFEAEGAGTIIGLGNGDPNCHEMDKGTQHSLFNGYAQTIVRSKEGSSGSLTLHVKSAGLKPATVTIQVQQAPSIPSVPVAAAQ